MSQSCFFLNQSFLLFFLLVESRLSRSLSAKLVRISCHVRCLILDKTRPSDQPQPHDHHPSSFCLASQLWLRRLHCTLTLFFRSRSRLILLPDGKRRQTVWGGSLVPVSAIPTKVGSERQLPISGTAFASHLTPRFHEWSKRFFFFLGGAFALLILRFLDCSIAAWGIRWLPSAVSHGLYPIHSIRREREGRGQFSCLFTPASR